MDTLVGVRQLQCPLEKLSEDMLNMLHLDDQDNMLEFLECHVDISIWEIYVSPTSIELFISTTDAARM